MARANGGRLTVLINGTEVADVWDSALREGSAGIFLGGDFNEAVMQRFHSRSCSVNWPRTRQPVRGAMVAPAITLGRVQPPISLAQQPHPYARYRRLCAIAGSQLAHHVQDMVLDRARSDPEAASNLFIPQPFDD